MIQTWALLVDAYRDLNSRKMFWIVLAVSALVAGSMAAVGLTPTGYTVFGYEFTSRFLNTREMSPAAFYKIVFTQLGIQWWLTVFAACLALISTASIFPDFLAGGAIDLYLSKPIGRWRLFLTKYLCGLLFVALQIAIFTVASFLVIGIRGDSWEWGIFLALPIVVVFYSYLYCFCVLIGVVTRSTVASILLTLLFWLCLFGLHTTEFTLLLFKTNNHRVHQDVLAQIDRDQTALAQIPPSTTPSWRQQFLQNQLAKDEKARDEYTPRYDRVHQWFYLTMVMLPKTSETVDLLQRKLLRKSDTDRGRGNSDDQDDAQSMNSGQGFSRADFAAVGKEARARTWQWITGTSLIFEAVVLVLAGWIFCRRDY
jgi:ABC-type transport system involved in multi-copper enzyme maturation permease subunit